MRFIVAMVIFLTAIMIFDTVAIWLLQMWNHPITVHLMGYNVPHAYLVLILQIVYMGAIVEWFMVVWYDRHSKKRGRS